MARDQRDHYYRRAKAEGYRARSAYKLLQMNERFHLIQEGDRVVDLGAAPGGWLQVARELVGDEGRVVGVDLEEIEPIPGVTTLQADITDERAEELIRQALGGMADVVICDAAPNLSGAWDRDHAISIDLARSALRLARRLLKPGGDFIVKVFQGDMFQDFLEEARREFSSVQAHSPRASRKESAETYIVARSLLSAPVRRGEILEVSIASEGRSGDGVAVVEGFAVIVRKARVGERLRVRVVDVKPRYAFAEILERKG
ncbi:MAG: 23S rRNA (uridine(2552)-2'-O)-methyltransferase [Methanothrix sp.]|nr:23S rRNA (uridine(2552)-2'-O)-methyltransferase [Methanothrix sp.]